MLGLSGRLIFERLSLSRSVSVQASDKYMSGASDMPRERTQDNCHDVVVLLSTCSVATRLMQMPAGSYVWRENHSEEDA